MKTRFALFVCTLIWGTSTQAQDSETIIPAWKIGKAGFSVFTDVDDYQSMTLDQMFDHARAPETLFNDLDGFQEQGYTSVGGVGIRLDLGLFKQSEKHNGINFNQEFNIGLNIHLDREAMVTMGKADALGRSSTTHSNILFCNIDNEIALSGEYLFKAGNRFKVFAGVGANVGTTFGKEVLTIFSRYTENHVTGEVTDDEWLGTNHHLADPSIYYRAYVPVGISHTFFRRFEASLTGRYGVGAQKVLGGKNYMIRHHAALMLSGRYYIKPLNTKGKGGTIKELLNLE